MGHVFGIEKYKAIGKRGIIGAILTISCGFLVMGAETAHPIRMLIYNVLTPNFHSAIWWMGTLYGVYLFFIIVEFYFLMTHNHKGAFYAGLGGVLAGISAHSNLGAVFGLLEARPFWHGPYLPIYFILSALVSGSALIIIINAVAYGGTANLPEKVKDALSGIAKIFALLLGILIFFEIWKIISSIYGAPPEKYESTMALMFGPLKVSFWFFEIFLGMLLPFALLVFTKAKNLKVALFASISAIIGIFFMRYNLVVAGQLHPMRTPAPGAGVEGATVSGFVTYTPTFTEVAVVIGAVALCIELYLLVERLLKLDE
jgi:molybdopterin-containing oxidoreductase family membrane subunit